MKNTSPQFDEYIADAPEFARPYLTKLRSLFHKACPDVEEVMKWSFPHFQYRGLLASMAAFKKHIGFSFWKGNIMSDPYKLLEGVGATSMCSIRVAEGDKLPSDKILLEYMREAVRLNEEGIAPKRASARKVVNVPDYFLSALKKTPKAMSHFETFSPSQKREYVEWITEAKQEATRAKRLETALEWIAEGKSRHWKYQR